MGFSSGKNVENNINLTEAQTLSNKTLDSTNTANGIAVNGGTIDAASITNPSRVDVKKDTQANLETYAATATDGQLVYATDTQTIYQIKNNALNAIGGAGGSLDIYYTESFDNLTSLSGFSTGNNATFLGAGSLAGSLAFETVSPISGAKSLSYTQAAGSLNDYFASPVIDVENKQQNNDSGMTFYFEYSGNDDDLKFVVWDVTNSTELTSGVELVKVSSTAKRYALSFYVPATCNQIRWGAQVLVENSGAELVMDDVEITSNPFVFKDLIDPRTVVIGAGNGGQSITANVTDIPFTEVEDDFGLWDGDSLTVDSDGDYLITGSVAFTTNVARRVRSFINGSVSRNLTDVSTSSILQFNGVVTLEKGQTLTLRTSDNGGTLNNSTENHHIHIQKIPESTEHVITPAKSTLSDWTSYTPTNTQGFGTISGVNLEYKRLGDTLKVRGYFTAGTIASVEAQLELPNSLVIKDGVNTSNVGTYVRDATAPTNGGPILSTEGDTFVNFGPLIYSDATVGGLSQQTANLIAANGDRISLEFEVPIAEWSSDATFLAAIPTPKTAYIKDVKPSGTAGGTFTSGAWQTRDLNTLEGDTGFVSLSSNTVTLQPGKYKIKASAPAYRVDRHKIKLRNITDSTDDIIGTSALSAAAVAVDNTSSLEKTITITSSKTFELQHQCQTTRSSDGFGNACSFSVDEIYTSLEIEKIG